MTPRERAGRRLYLTLAGLIFLDQLIGIALALGRDGQALDWRRSVYQPILLCLLVGFLWTGDGWLRWLTGVACVLKGLSAGLPVVQVLVKLAYATPPDAAGFFITNVLAPLAWVLVWALAYVAMGLAFMFSPALLAFYRYQREGPAPTVKTL